MDRLQVQLVVGFDRNKAHVLAFNRLSDGLGIHEVVLVRLHKGLHELGCDQPNIVALLAQCPTQEMSPGASLQADQRSLQWAV